MGTPIGSDRFRARMLYVAFRHRLDEVLPDSQTHSRLKVLIQEIESRWLLESQDMLTVFATDGGANLTKACKTLQDEGRVHPNRCAAHSIDNVVRQAINPKAGTARVRFP